MKKLVLAIGSIVAVGVISLIIISVQNCREIRKNFPMGLIISSVLRDGCN